MMEYTDSSSLGRSQGVVVGADDTPFADSGRIEDTDCNRIWENNEKIIASIFLAPEKEINGRPEVLVKIDRFDDCCNNSDTHLTIRTVETSRSPIKNVMFGGSLSRDREEVLRPGCLLDIRKADLEGTPSQKSLGAAHVPLDPGSPDLELRIGFKHPVQGLDLRSAACVWLGADEPNFEAEIGRTSFVTKRAVNGARSFTDMASGNCDLSKQNNLRVLTTRTASVTPITHNSFPPNFIYSKDYLYMRKDNFVHFFYLDHKVESQTTKDLLDNNKFSLEQFRPYNPNVGETMDFTDTKPLTFHLFVKSHAVEPVNHVHLKSSVLSLKHATDTLNVKTISISKYDNNIEPIGWD
ncbi:uncharacterized protein LOC143368059 [Andrena cerasifolii]|uniref:uncharacterized protein LOC143368059 n=1 Tax=Andrena cerasifolii TaxID=2819439 RepID=UPI00403762F8